MIEIREVNSSPREKYEIIDSNTNYSVYSQGPKESILYDVLREFVIKRNSRDIDEYFFKIEEFDSKKSFKEETVNTIISGKWFWKKEKIVTEIQTKYYRSCKLCITDKYKIGLLHKYFEKREEGIYELKEEYLYKSYQDLTSFIEAYLYCLNLLDWPDIDYWAEQSLKL